MRIVANFCVSVMALLVIAHIFSGSAFAAHPLITDDTGTQGRGKFQLEINGGYGHDKGEGATIRSLEIATILSYGIIDNLDVILGVPYQYLRVKGSETTVTESGLSDVSLELKWRFYEKDGFSFALKPGVTLPTGDEEKGLGAGKATYSVFLISTKAIEPWAFHLNFGYIRNDNKSDERKDIWHASLASEFEAVKDLKIVANIGVEKNPDKSSNTNPAFMLAGIIYSVTESVNLDFGIKAGLNKTETDYTILAGIALRF